MSKIYNISAGFLQICENYLGKKDISPREIFQRLSYEMGGDGQKITKKQLDDYISKAESEIIKIDKNRLQALKRIQKDWDNISGGKNSITYNDMEGYEALLLATVVGTFTEIEIKEKEEEELSLIEEIYDFLKKSLGLSEDEEVSKEDLVEYLSKILSETSQDDLNTELVSTLTNIIAKYSENSTMEMEI